ncbi:MAG: hypothetical protein ACLU02_05845 [Clostridia bacterium]|jgi:hypothetical protein
MDGNAKHDLEHTAEKSVSMSAKISKISTILFGRFLIKANRYYQKHFSSSMRALRKDGATKELCVSPPLTRAEVKQIITSCHENNILMGIKKMHPDGELSNNKSLYQQEKLAHNEIKYKKWDERRKATSKIKILNKICKHQADKYKNISAYNLKLSNRWLSFQEKTRKIKPLNKYCKMKADNYKNIAIQEKTKDEEEQYVIIFNKSKLSFFNEQLAKIPPNRLKQETKSDLDGINNEEIIDDRNIEPMVSRGMNLSVNDLNKIGEDFGSCPVRDYSKNYCIQKITKEEYCEIREQLFELPSHGACVLNEKEMIIAIRSEDLDEYREYAPERPIKEYGSSGGRAIESESNIHDIMELEINDIKRYKEFKETYSSKDYVAEIAPNGKTTILLKETDTKNLLEESKKKSKTEDLVKEANELAEKSKTDKVIENVALEQKEEQEIDR